VLTKFVVNSVPAVRISPVTWQIFRNSGNAFSGKGVSVRLTISHKTSDLTAMGTDPATLPTNSFSTRNPN
jgi:hypothetical protein